MGFRLGWIQELKQSSQGLVFLHPLANFLPIVTPSQQSRLKKEAFYFPNASTTLRLESHWPKLGQMPIHSPTSVPLIGKPRSRPHFWHGESRESGQLHPNQMNPMKRSGPPKETEVLFPEEAEDYGGPELALKSETPVHPG